MGIEIVDVASDFVHTVDDVEIYGRNDKVGAVNVGEDSWVSNISKSW